MFSKYDHGIKLDDESWYSVTPESLGEYITERVCKTFPQESEIHVLDAFAGCGGNIIQFGKRCTKVYGCDIDQTKINYCQNNCKIYGVSNYKVLLKDYLEATAKDFDNKKINAVFLSPPWGGTGYTQMHKYKFEYMHPNFNDTLSKSLEFTKNLILYIPRNTDLTELCSILSVYAEKMNDMGRQNEVVFEIERLGHFSGASTSILVVYTGDLAHVQNYEIVDHLCEHYLNLPSDPKLTEELMTELVSLLDLKGPSCFINDVFVRKGQERIGAEDLVKKKIKRLSHHDQAILGEIKDKYMAQIEHEHHEEEKSETTESKKPKNQWWIKSSAAK